jgi:hypothetical protein
MKRRNDTNVNQYYRAVRCAIIGLRNRIKRTVMLIFSCTFVVTNGDLSFGEMDCFLNSPFEAFII